MKASALPNQLAEKVITVHDTVKAYFRYQLARARCALGKGIKPKPGDKHLLILAWLFPPTISGGVYRPLSFARYAAERGWRVTVVAGPTPEVITAAGQYLLGQLPSDVRVIRVKQCETYLSHRVIPSLDGRFAHVIETLETVLSLDDLHPSIIFASGPPFHNFVSAWHLSRYFRAPLVLDYRDEWTQCPFEFVHAGEFDLVWEKRCLEHARSVIVTTRSFAEHAIKTFPKIDSSKYTLIPNGFDPADLPKLTPTNHKTKLDAPIDIVFLGHLASHTPPHDFISTLRQALTLRPELMDRLRLKFVGTRTEDMPDKLQRSELGHLIQLVEQVPKPEAVRIMHESTMLLILNPPTLNRYIPGKLFDYVASGSPILVYGEGGEVARIVSELNAGHIVPEGDPDSLIGAIDQIISATSSPDLVKREAWLASHHREHLANQLINHLDNILING